jgi:uncharacterized membrane protein YdjX (TVP38/TMEM64 family)
MLFLRITPLLPNVFINVASPIVNVPYSTFFLATFFGLMPMNVVHINTGLMLNEIQQYGANPKVIFSKSRNAILMIV